MRDIKPTYIRLQYAIIHIWQRYTWQIYTWQMYNYFFWTHNTISLKKKKKKNQASRCVNSCFLYKSRLAFINFQRRIYPFQTATKATALEKRREKKKAKLIRLLNFTHVRLPTAFLARAIGNVSLKWHDPRRRRCREKGGILSQEMNADWEQVF